MAKLIGAVIREQGVTFAVALVKDPVIRNRTEAARVTASVSGLLRCQLVALIGESTGEVVANRRDIADFVASIDHDRIPWREYLISR